MMCDLDDEDGGEYDSRDDEDDEDDDDGHNIEDRGIQLDPRRRGVWLNTVVVVVVVVVVPERENEARHEKQTKTRYI
jgi:hypothetical protein